MRAAAIWLCLGFLWLLDAAFALRSHDARHTFVAGIAALGFLCAGFYHMARKRRYSSR
jgi:hypothetical protein